MSTPRTIASLGNIRHISGEINRIRSDADAGLAAALVRAEPVHQGAWRWQAVRQHVEHAMAHLDAWHGGGAAEDHLGHAAVRLLMALQVTEGWQP